MAKPLHGRWGLNLWGEQWGEAYRLRLDMVRRTHIECLLVILLTEVVNNTKDFGNFVFSNHKDTKYYRGCCSLQDIYSPSVFNTPF